tara:strand:- start:31 stop:294 length:264 start_codon:yes stop_codon:yes gene_type:complete
MGAGNGTDSLSKRKKIRITEPFNSKKMSGNKDKVIVYDAVIYGLLFYLLINPKFLSLTKNIIPKKYFKEVLALIFASIYFLKSKYYD